MTLPFPIPNAIALQRLAQAAEPQSNVQPAASLPVAPMGQKVVPVAEVVQLLQDLRNGERPWPLGEEEDFYYLPGSGFVFSERFL